jgi:hypothetical protein
MGIEGNIPQRIRPVGDGGAVLWVERARSGGILEMPCEMQKHKQRCSPEGGRYKIRSKSR